MDAADQIEQCSFTRAIRTNDAENLSFFHSEAHVVHCGQSAELDSCLIWTRRSVDWNPTESRNPVLPAPIRTSICSAICLYWKMLKSCF